MVRSVRAHDLRRSQAKTLSYLVVGAMLALLLSLMTPAMESAIDRAALLQCQTRMRGLNLAVRNYAVENRQRLPEWLDGAVGVTSFWWYRLHANNYVRSRDFNNIYAPGPLDYQSPFVCPERANNGDTWNTASLPEWIAYNIFLGFANANDPSGPWGEYYRVKLTKVERHDQTFMFTDGHRYSANHPGQPNSNVRGDYILAVTDIMNVVGRANLNKHEKGSNYLFVDGHVEFISPEDASFRAKQGQTGTNNGQSEPFVLPFPNSRVKK